MIYHTNRDELLRKDLITPFFYPILDLWSQGGMDYNNSGSRSKFKKRSKSSHIISTDNYCIKHATRVASHRQSDGQLLVEVIFTVLVEHLPRTC